MSNKSIPIVPFLLNQRECKIYYCKWNQDLECVSRDIEMFESLFDEMGKRLKFNSDRGEAVLDDSKPYVCTYYELSKLRCPECKEMLYYAPRDVNYICMNRNCMHGHKD